MKIQAPKRILTSDFAEDDQRVAGQLAGILNTFLEEVYSAVSGKLTIGDNLNQEIKILKLTVVSGIPTTNVSFRNPLRSKINGITVKRAIGTAYPNSAPFISFTEADGVVRIDHVTGLPDNTEYQLITLLTGD